MNFNKKQPTEFSKLLKENDAPKITKEIIYKKYEKQNSFITKNILLITLIVILSILTLIYLILYSFLSLTNSLYDENDDFDYWNNEYKVKKSNFTHLFNESKICSQNKKFAILSRTNCEQCGLFSYYIVHLGCIITFLDQGYIPIIETMSYPNVFNGYNISTSSNKNHWEEFFNQPCGYTLDEVKNKDDVLYFECECSDNMPSEKELYSNKTLIEYYNKIAKKYMSVKQNIIDESKEIFEKLFKNSNNVLGILVRGTDYITIRPEGHSIPPTPEMAIHDAIKMNKKNNYDFIFLATEDNNIRQKFIKKFKDKVKYLLPEKNIEYNYEEENYLTLNEDVIGNMNFEKTYLLSMIILSKCIDIISSRTSGAAGAFILSEGFRNDLVYYLGEY